MAKRRSKPASLKTCRTLANRIALALKRELHGSANVAAVAELAMYLELAAALLAKAPTGGAEPIPERKRRREPAAASITGVLPLIEEFQRPFQERPKFQPSFSRQPIGQGQFQAIAQFLLKFSDSDPTLGSWPLSRQAVAFRNPRSSDRAPMLPAPQRL